MENKQAVSVRLTMDQYNLARRRLFTEDQTWQTVLNALVNAYIMGDVSVTRNGRYMLLPPSGYEPVIEIEREGELVEVEPKWGISSPRPQVGQGNPSQHPKSRTRDRWGTRELAHYLRTETGRQVSLQNLRRLLRAIDTPKDGRKWHFSGPEDPEVKRVVDHIHKGTYDTLVEEGIRNATKAAAEVQRQEKEKQDADELTAEQRRIQHLRKLRRIQNS